MFLPHTASKELGYLPLWFGIKSNSQKKPKRRKLRNCSAQEMVKSNSKQLQRDDHPTRLPLPITKCYCTMCNYSSILEFWNTESGVG
jgi:hypothetical protein